MGTIKDRNAKDLIEAEESERGGKNTQKNCTKMVFKKKKKVLNTRKTMVVWSLA